MDLKQKTKSVFYPTNQMVVFIIYILGTFAFAVYEAADNTDLWNHLLIGKYIYDFAQIPHKAMFVAGLADMPFVFHEWLSELGMYITYHYFGFLGIRLMRGILITLSFFAILMVLRRMSTRNITQLFFFPVLIYTLYDYFTERPYLFSLLFFIILYYLLNRYLKESKKIFLVAIVLMNLVWANLHAGWMQGLAFFGLFLFGTLIDEGWSANCRNLSIAFIAFFLAGLCTPYGWKELLLPIKVMPTSKYLSEWRSPLTGDLYYAIGFISLFVTSFIFGFRRFKKGHFKEWLPLILFSVMGLYSQRDVFFAVPLLVFSIAPHLDKLFREKLSQYHLSRGLSMALIVGLVGISIACAFVLTPYRDMDSVPPPVELIDKIPHGQKVVLMTEEWWWSDFALYQYNSQKWDASLQVMQDIRSELYTENRFKEYIELERGAKDTLEILDKHHVNTIIIGDYHPMVQILNNSGRYRLVDSQDHFLLFRKI